MDLQQSTSQPEVSNRLDKTSPAEPPSETQLQYVVNSPQLTWFPGHLSMECHEESEKSNIPPLMSINFSHYVRKELKPEDQYDPVKNWKVIPKVNLKPESFIPKGWLVSKDPKSDQNPFKKAPTRENVANIKPIKRKNPVMDDRPDYPNFCGRCGFKLKHRPVNYCTKCGTKIR